MNEPPSSRREFLKHTARIATASALAGATLPCVHAAEDNTIRLALIGCGGRGCGAVVDAFESPAARSSWWRWPTCLNIAWRPLTRT